jgi:hypothetical protein
MYWHFIFNCNIIDNNIRNIFGYGVNIAISLVSIAQNVHLDHFSNAFAGDVSCIEIIISLSSCTCIDPDRLLVRLHS